MTPDPRAEREQGLRLVTAALREALLHVPEERRTHKRFIHIDAAAGSTYELDDAEWWIVAQATLAGVEKVLAVIPPPVEAPPQPSLTPADLIALRDEWRKEAARHTKHGDSYRVGQGWGLEQAADQLDALITRLGEKTSATDDK